MVSADTTGRLVEARNVASLLNDSQRAVLDAASREDLYSDGNRWWDERQQTRLTVRAAAWCRAAELVERAPDFPMRPWRIFRLTEHGRNVVRFLER